MHFEVAPELLEQVGTNRQESAATSRTRAPSGALVEKMPPRRTYNERRARVHLTKQGRKILFSTSAPLGALVLLVASDSCLCVCLCVCPHLLEQLRSNFKVQLRWLPLTESTQIFFCDSVCVSSTWLTMCHVPHGHMLFYVGGP